ncbi:MAG: alpha/beta hydrolase-fold protein [Chloroflexota bacterium]|nr:alpha/beta hydrolase-fold protein [Chloroflexota bacterium]
MRRDITGWYSDRLYMDMPIVAYGHAGHPILMVPTAAADFLEYERFYLISAIQPFIESGRVRVYSVDSVNRQSLLNPGAPPDIKVEYLARYDSYLINEVLPFIRNDTGNQDTMPLIFGISMGGYLAANTFFKHPDLFGGTILFSGSYDIRGYLNGYYSDKVFFNNPVDFLPNLNDDYYLPILQSGSRAIILYSGQGAWESPSRTIQLSRILSSKNIPHELDLWGHDVDHDWPWWRKALPYYLDRLFG